MPVPNNLYLIQADVFPGKLAVAARPRGNDWLEDDLQAWKRQGISHVVSLLEEEENERLELTEEETLSRRLGLQFVNLPIPDRGTPKDAETFATVVNDLHDTLLTGGRVIIHCRQGIGRSGLLAAAVLSSFELPLQDVLERISLARGVTIPETEDQLRWLRNHANLAHA